MGRYMRTAILVALVAGSSSPVSADEPAPPTTEPTPEPVTVPVGEPPAVRSPAERGGMPGGMPGGGGGPPGYEAIWYPASGVGGQDADLGFVRQSLNLGVPVWRDGGDMVLTTVGVRNTLFQTDAILPDSGRPFPDQLWNMNFGLNYIHRFRNGWTGMLLSGFGSASDEAFHSIREMTANLGGMVRFPAANGRDTWTLGALYMFGGPVNFPLPIIGYGWNPSERLRVNVGLPMSVCWRPADDWTLDLSYVPLLTINARLAWQVAPSVRVYGGYEYLNESYFLTDRVNVNDRFFVLEQRLMTGVKWEVGKAGLLDVNTGYSFGRYFGEGESQWSSLRDRVDVQPAAFLGASFRLRF